MILLIKTWEQNDTKFKIYEVDGKYNLYANGYFECRKDTVDECEKKAFFIETILFPLKRL